MSEMTFRGLEIWDLGIIGLGFVNLGNWEDLVLEQLRKWARDVRSGTRARTEHGRSGDPGLWVRNKEQWADRGSEQPTPSCLCERTPCQDPKSSRAAARTAFVTIINMAAVFSAGSLYQDRSLNQTKQGEIDSFRIISCGPLTEG
jgi:hypothetical protein